jgi:starch synthase
MDVVVAASEVAPFAKTGGLADVGGALPKFVAELGHDVAVILPLHRQAREAGEEIQDTGRTVAVPIMDRSVRGRIFESRLPGSDVPAYLIGNDDYFDRDSLYVDPATNEDYKDNCERYVFFSRAVLEAAEALDRRPDVIHCNDWQTGLIPVYLRTLYARGRAVSGAASLFTVHNLAYQGVFWHWDMKLTGLDWGLFNWKQLEYYGNLNCLKAGLVFADVLNTVSKRYAEEIQTEEFGCGLDGVLRERSGDLYGVVNGVDYGVWNPETDPLIPAHYSAEDLSGKGTCKRALLESVGLPERGEAPLVGIISRLSPQKGFDILELALEDILALGIQMVVLGTGEPKYHEMFEAAAGTHPKALAACLTFSNEMAHRIEAGSDLFLMPSRYEPCGLNQLYSLRYGTVPVVRAAGGLADTVIDCTEETLADGTATGFVFEHYDPAALLEAVERAMETLGRRDDWARLVRTGMAQDWSWARGAREYERLYELARQSAR